MAKLLDTPESLRCEIYQAYKTTLKSLQHLWVLHITTALHSKNTESTILSACETDLGDIKNGEGVYGLQRAFLMAGAKTLILSFWKVADEVTQQLMLAFYQNWLTGKMRKRQAPKTARQFLREQEKYAHPACWRVTASPFLFARLFSPI